MAQQRHGAKSEEKKTSSVTYFIQRHVPSSAVCDGGRSLCVHVSIHIVLPYSIVQKS